MCNVEGDIEDISNCSEKIKNIIIGSLKKCKKCDDKPVLLLQKKDPFCKKCFFEYCDHKFRSTIGKTKKVKHGQHVLIACSGGRKSSTLLHLIKKALDSASAKQISFIPGILFVNESLGSLSSDEENQLKDMFTYFKSFGYPLLISNIEMVRNLSKNEDIYISLDSSSDIDISLCMSSEKWLNNYMEKMPLSTKLDFIKHIRLRLMTEIASRAGYDYLFMGDTATSLAIDLLTNIGLGRGSQISSDTNFLDTRYKVPICKPIREFQNKELALYLYLHKCPHIVLPKLETKTDRKSCIQRLTEDFVTNLERDFPATVFTIFRTGDKLSKQMDLFANETCLLCQSVLDNVQPDVCSAIEAMEISKKLSEKDEITLNGDFADSSKFNTYENILKFLCHGCSIQFRNNQKSYAKNLIPFVSDCYSSKMERIEMKEDIKEYLIDEDLYC